MDIAADDSSALILTYRGVYFYSRNNDENWSAAFRRPPLELLLRRAGSVMWSRLRSDPTPATPL
jgi:hypothetical protein